MKETIERLALITGASASFGATFTLALADRSSAATVMAALTVAFMALYFLPLIDSIEAFGLKAKLREKVVEADKVLDGLRSTALVASNIMYAQLGWIGRMGTPSWEERRRWFMDLDRNLRELGVEPKTIAELQEPFLAFVNFDLYLPWEQAVGARLQHHSKAISAEITEARIASAGDADSSAKIAALVEKRRAVDAAIPGLENAYASPEIFSLNLLIERRLAMSPLPEDEKAKLRLLGGKFARIADGVQRQGSITDEGHQMLQEHVLDSRAWLNEYQSIFSEA